MGEETVIQKSLVEQILDETFAKIEGQKEFDTSTIEKLKELAASGGLTKANRVAEAIKVTPEVQNYESA